MIPKIKICGLTKLEDAEMLNEIKADYAGFVFFEKSKRNVSFEKGMEIKKRLLPEIKTVAVTVSPDLELIERLEEKFDIVQIHGELKEEVLEKVQIPIWRAYNLDSLECLKQLEQHEKILGYVMDAKAAGSGRVFDWEKSQAVMEEVRKKYFCGKKIILAGGLNTENVREGIKIFSPDAVDVSSGVEEKNGKDRNLIMSFGEKVREI